MHLRRTITSVLLRRACGLLLVLGIGCNNSNQFVAPDPVAKTVNAAPSNPESLTHANDPMPMPAPQVAQPTPPVVELAPVDAPMTPRVVPQIAQQNLYSGGQPPLGLPRIALSEQHAKACPIKLGQVFPNQTLTDQAGQPQELHKLRGKFTLVVVWSASEPAAVEEFGDLEAYAYQPYKNVGLQVIAVHTLAGKKKQPTEALQKHKPTFTILHDTNGELWTKVGRESLPRTFLLDGEGKVLWFDMEYSRTTRRQLQQALQAVMQEI